MNKRTTHFLTKLFFSFLLSVGFIAAANAQSAVKLNLNHHLAGVDFAYFQTAQNNLGNPFDLKRLEYYISEIVLVHDGGLETTVDDHFILVEATDDLTYDLGNFPITTIEGLRFSIGIEPDFNHTDPAIYPVDHPLSPQLPSMHWGWAAGYRFVAMEGKTGAGVDVLYEIHALGDVNYFEVDLTLGATTVGSDLVIDVYADYTKALEGIDISAGLIEHSEENEAADLLANFRDLVFSPTAPPPVSGVADLFEGVSVVLYPNPSIDGEVLLSFETPAAVSSQELIVTSINGQEILRKPLDLGRVHELLTIENNGTYLVSILAQGKLVYTTQFAVTR